MIRSATNLKRILEHLEITNVSLARGVSVDASLVSRWLNGQRQLKLSSDTLNSLAEFLLDRIIRTNSTDWLKHQMEIDGLVFDCASAESLFAGLRVWLSVDGIDVSKTLDLIPQAARVQTDPARDHVRTGDVEIVLFLESIINSLPAGSRIDIHLSKEDIGIVLHEAISRMLLDSIMNNGSKIRLLITMSSDVTAMSRLLDRYTQAMVEGFLSVAVVHGMTQDVINQATFIFENRLVFIVCETPKSIAPPIGIPTYDASFIKESKKSFEHTYNYSHPLLRRYDDNLARNVLDIMYYEFTTPGDLDIIKDNINPLYMTTDAYNQFLGTLGNKGKQLKWRAETFARYKTGMDENLGNGTVFREMISLKRLNQIIIDGMCKMPAIYFFGTGLVSLNAAGCLSTLEGYIGYLNRFANFHLVVLDEISDLNENNCWHIKQNSHWMLNGWNKDESIILYTDQLMLMHEFQSRYNEIWDKSHYSEGRRKQTIATLQDSIARLKANHDLA